MHQLPCFAMPDTARQKYMALVDRLVQLADKEELGRMREDIGDECRPLQKKYGEMPLQDRLAMTYADELNDQQAELVRKEWKRWWECWEA